MISCLDERYSDKLQNLSLISSEKELYKLYWELEVLYFNSVVKHIVGGEFVCKDYFCDFDDFIFEEIKKEESKTQHDIYAIINVLKKYSKGDDLNKYIHFGLTSSDIKGVAETIRFGRYMNLFSKRATSLQSELKNCFSEYYDRPVLSYTHGQPATPYDFNDFLFIHFSNIKKSLSYVYELVNTVEAKFGGANGKFNCMAPFFSYKGLEKLKDDFFASVNKKYVQTSDRNVDSLFYISCETTPTTQISSYIQVSNILFAIKVFCLKLISFSQDIWLLQSLGVVRLQKNDDEIGSSTMPHKINPIDFENAEGNLKFAISVLDEIVSSLLVSRLGRDLSSSTEQRNISLLMGHIFVGIDKLTTGIKKITVNSEHIDHNNENYSVLSEYYQLVLKWIGHDNGYDSLKRALRGSKDPKASIMQFLYRDFDEQSYCRNYAELIKNEGFEVLETPSEYSKILDVFR